MRGQRLAYGGLALVGIVLASSCLPPSPPAAPMIAPKDTLAMPASSPTDTPARRIATPPPSVTPRATASPTPIAASNGITVTIVYDNNPYDERLETSWGFACLVERGDLSLLFDTGADPAILLANMAVLGIDPTAIDVVVISHNHSDHTAGLGAILARNASTTVYLPQSLPASTKRGIADRATVIEVGEAMELAKGIYTTGEMGTTIHEQALALATERGAIVITGCAHPGVVDMVARAKEVTAGDIRLVLGGFHLTGASQAAIANTAKDLQRLGVQQVAPCHCSGDAARRLFAEIYGPAYLPLGVGARLLIRDETITLAEGRQ